MLGIVANYATPYHPPKNEQVERYNNTIVRQVRHYVRDHVKTWDQYISVLTTAYNSQVHESTREALFSVVIPHRMRGVALQTTIPTRHGPASTRTPRATKAMSIMV